jgi:hypothetical protein
MLEEVIAVGERIEQPAKAELWSGREVPLRRTWIRLGGPEDQADTRAHTRGDREVA